MGGNIFLLDRQERAVSVFPSAQPGAPVIYLNTFSGEGRQVFEAAQNAGCPPFTLVAVSGLDWNRDMAPWNSPAAFQNGEPFTGGADGYLKLLTETILPEAERLLPAPPQWRGIAGYSLAGLFALYAVCRAGVFSRAGSVSGSLWFPGFQEYFFTHAPQRRPDCIYFSLGDREAKTRNPTLRTVQKKTEEMHAFCQSKGIRTVFRLNPGNHFVCGIERTASCLEWLLGGDGI